MPRYRLLIEYDGGPFSGWQRQAVLPSVQACVEEAVLQLTQQQCTVHAAGRTDSGVHALGQVAHFDADKVLMPDRVRDGLNFYLKPYPVVILEARVTDDSFHSRFSAKERSYIYRILPRRVPPALERGRVWHVRTKLDIDAMRAAAAHLVGHHDFSSFRATECQSKSPIKTLDRLDVSQVGEEIHVYAKARSFLHHQVRNMVGTLKCVGEGSWRVEDVPKALAAKQRSAGGPTAPPDGLHFNSVEYDD